MTNDNKAPFKYQEENIVLGNVTFSVQSFLCNI